MSLQLSPLTGPRLAKAAAVMATMVIAFALGALSRNSPSVAVKSWIDQLLPPPAAHQITIYGDAPQPVVQLETPRLIRASAKSRLEPGKSPRHRLTPNARKSHCHSHIRAFRTAASQPHFHSAAPHKSHHCSRLQAGRGANSAGRTS